MWKRRYSATGSANGSQSQRGHRSSRCAPSITNSRFRSTHTRRNHHPASQRRLKVLRNVAAGPLPGQTLVVYDPLRGLVVDCQPCEDAHKQERAILLDLFDRDVEEKSVWIADRNFCTTYFLFELDFRKASSWYAITHNCHWKLFF